jgi:hypothetical protein
VRIPAALVLGLVFCGLATAQNWFPCRHYASGPKARFLPDQNRDGVADLLVVDPNYDNLIGHIRIVSGADLTTLFEIVTPRGLTIGSGAVEVLDVDRDQVPDLLIGDRDGNDNGGRGTLFAYSGATRQLLWTLTGAVANEHFGQGVCLIDVHPLIRDGIPELVVASPGEGFLAQGNTPGFIRAFDLRATPPTQLWFHTRGGDREFFGTSVANLGDAYGNGFPVLAVGMPGHHLGPDGWIVTFSGIDGRFVTVIPGPQGLGSSLAAADLDGDGRLEALAGLDGYVGRGGALLYTTTGNALNPVQTFPPRDESTGKVVRMLPDVDGDNVRDLAVLGASRIEVYSGRPPRGLLYQIPVANFPSRGFVDADYGQDLDGDNRPDWVLGHVSGPYGLTVYSRTDHPFQLDQNTYPVSRRGNVDFHLRAGPQHAGRFYVMACSASGSQPGVTLTPTVHVPLNIDPFLTFALANVNVTPFVNFFGTLDATGYGKGTWSYMPALRPQFVGLRLHFAAVVISQGPNYAFQLGTNAQPFVLDR